MLFIFYRLWTQVGGISLMTCNMYVVDLPPLSSPEIGLRIENRREQFIRNTKLNKSRKYEKIIYLENRIYIYWIKIFKYCFLSILRDNYATRDGFWISLIAL